MTFFARLFGTQEDPREQWRPLWYRVVEEARDNLAAREAEAGKLKEALDRLAEIG